MAGQQPEGTSVYFGSDGRWHGRVTMGLKPNGDIDRRHVSGKSEADVRTKVADLVDLRVAGAKRAQPRLTVAQYLNTWIHGRAAHELSHIAWRGYECDVRLHLIPRLGRHRLDRLDRAHIEAAYLGLDGLRKTLEDGTEVRKYRPATIEHIHRTLSSALGDAVRDKLLATNPASGADLPKDRSTDASPFRVKPFNDAEITAILHTARTLRGGVRYVVALACGMRQGECLGLHWEDVHLDGEDPYIEVRQQLQRHSWRHGCADEKGKKGWACGKRRGCDCPQRHSGGLVLVQVKTEAGQDRRIGIPPEVVTMLRKQKRMQSKERLRAGSAWVDAGFVFAQPDGKPISPEMDHAGWELLLSDAGVRDARLHDARHTSATFLLLENVDSRVVMDVMGWSSAAMLKRYQHVVPGLRTAAATRVGSRMFGA